MKYLTSARLFRLYYTEQMPAQKGLLREVKLPPQFKGYAEMLRAQGIGRARRRTPRRQVRC